MLDAEVTDRCEDGIELLHRQMRILLADLGEAVTDFLVVNGIVLRIVSVKKFYDRLGFSGLCLQ